MFFFYNCGTHNFAPFLLIYSFYVIFSVFFYSMSPMLHSNVNSYNSQTSAKILSKTAHNLSTVQQDQTLLICLIWQ